MSEICNERERSRVCSACGAMSRWEFSGSKGGCRTIWWRVRSGWSTPGWFISLYCVSMYTCLCVYMRNVLEKREGRRREPHSTRAPTTDCPEERNNAAHTERTRDFAGCLHASNYSRTTEIRDQNIDIRVYCSCKLYIYILSGVLAPGATRQRIKSPVGLSRERREEERACCWGRRVWRCFQTHVHSLDLNTRVSTPR